MIRAFSANQVFSCVHTRLAFKSGLLRIVMVDAGFVTFRARRRISPNGFDPRIGYHFFVWRCAYSFRALPPAEGVK